MPETKLSVDVKTEAIERAIRKAPQEVARMIRDAGRVVQRILLDTEGLRRYPPQTQANMPPPPYYKRGVGYQATADKNYKNSENLKNKWSSQTLPYGLRISNSASYAPYVHGEEQAAHMADKHWEKLSDVANRKKEDIKRAYEKFIKMALRRAGFGN